MYFVIRLMLRLVDAVLACPLLLFLLTCVNILRGWWHCMEVSLEFHTPTRQTCVFSLRCMSVLSSAVPHIRALQLYNTGCKSSGPNLSLSLSL